LITDKAIFLDYDETLVKDTGYVKSPYTVQPLPGVIKALKMLQDAGYQLIIISNQSTIGRGISSVESVTAMLEVFNKVCEAFHIEPLDFFYCPHTPEDNCYCRKPEATMILQALRENPRLDHRKCFMVGDRHSDLQAGENAMVPSVLINKVKEMFERHGTRQYDTLLDFAKAVA
jgi:histidinol-phosphate phosphatase family protein